MTKLQLRIMQNKQHREQVEQARQEEASSPLITQLAKPKSVAFHYKPARTPKSVSSKSESAQEDESIPKQTFKQAFQ